MRTIKSSFFGRLQWAASVSVLIAAPLLFSLRSHSGSAVGTQAASVGAAAIPVGVVKVARENLSNETTLAAEFKPYQEVEVHAKVAGYVKDIFVDVGDRVTRGQLLAKLEIPELKDDLEVAADAVKHGEQEVKQAQAQLERSRSAEEIAHLSYTRMDAVLKLRPNLIAQQEIDDAQARDRVSIAQVSTDEAALAAAKEQLAQAEASEQKVKTLLAYSQITAPFSGVITKRYADTGAMIQAGTASNTQAMPLVRLSQNDRLRLVLPVPESVVSRIHLGAPVEVKAQALEKSFMGRISRFSQKLDTSTRTMETEVDVANPQLILMPGMYASAVLDLDRQDNVLSVPVQAVSGTGKNATVYVVNQLNKIEERPVTLGIETPTKFEVISVALALLASRSFAQTPQKITLREAEAIALSNHPQIQAAKMKALAAGEVVTEARSAYFPFAFGSLTGAGALDRSRIAAGGLNNPIIFNREADGITVSQLITDFGRTSNLVASTRQEAGAKAEDVNTARLGVLLEVDKAYFAVLRATAILKVAQETVSARQLVVDQVTAFAGSKLKSELDVSFANVNLAEAKLMLVQAQNNIKAADAELSAALGYADERTFELVDEPLPGTPLPDLPHAIQEAMNARPELKSMRLRRDSAEKFVDAEKALRYPTFSMLGSTGIIPWHDTNLSDRYGAAGLNINIPIFNGHLFSTRVDEAKFKFQAEDQNLRDLEDRISRDVRIVWLNADTAFQRLGLTQQLLAQASLALDLAEQRYNLGLGSIVEVSQAQLNKTQAEIEQASAKYEYQAQRAALAYETGALP